MLHRSSGVAANRPHSPAAQGGKVGMSMAGAATATAWTWQESSLPPGELLLAGGATGAGDLAWRHKQVTGHWQHGDGPVRLPARQQLLCFAWQHVGAAL